MSGRWVLLTRAPGVFPPVGPCLVPGGGSNLPRAEQSALALALPARRRVEHLEEGRDRHGRGSSGGDQCNGDPVVRPDPHMIMWGKVAPVAFAHGHLKIV